jgi:hypothetical protein
VFIHQVPRGQTPLVPSVRRRQKMRLPQQPLGAAIALSVQRFNQQLLVPIDALPLSPQLIVEPHHFGDETRTQMKWRHCTGGDGLGSRGVQDDLPFAGGQKGERLGEAGVEEVVEVVSGENNRSDSIGRRCECAMKMTRRAAGWHDNGGRTDKIRMTDGRARDNRSPEGVKVGDAHEPRPAGCNHRARGRRSRSWMSLRDLAPSIRAPAAAEEASQARSMLLASVASLRMRAAFSARCAALTNTA